MAAYPNCGRCGALLACGRIAMLHDKMWHRYVETRKAARLSLLQVVARCSGLNWQSYTLLPTSYCTPDEVI